MIELMSDRHPGVQQCMIWDGVRWAGMAFTPMGTLETFWDPDDPPTHWRPIEHPKCDYCLQHHAHDASCECADCKCKLHPQFIERWREGVKRLAICPDCYDVRRAAVGSN